MKTEVFSVRVPVGTKKVLPAAIYQAVKQLLVAAAGRQAGRKRRLQPGEQDRLLAAASPHLRALIIAALHTGCRKGELLSLTWGDVLRNERGEPQKLLLSASKTKTNEYREVPVGLNLRAVLLMRRQGPDGKDLPNTAYVFGNEVGERVGDMKKAWRATCRRAGITDLHFHDLRREFGSRLLESGAADHDVQALLGHADIKTTSRYLQTNAARLQRAIERMEDGAIRTSFAQTPVEPTQDERESSVHSAEKPLVQ